MNGIHVSFGIGAFPFTMLGMVTAGVCSDLMIFIVV